MRLSLDYDGHSRGVDKWVEYDTSTEREECITAYIHHHGDRIAEMAGTPNLADVEAPERFIDITEG